MILPFSFADLAAGRMVGSTGQPVMSQPEKIENFAFESCSSSVTVLREIRIPDRDVRVGADGDQRPCRGYTPNSFAGLVEVRATICSSVSFLVLTPSE